MVTRSTRQLVAFCIRWIALTLGPGEVRVGGVPGLALLFILGNCGFAMAEPLPGQIVIDPAHPTEKLAFAPGSQCGYSTFAFYHAALVCENVTGQPYDEFAVEALFKPIGCEHWWFQKFEGGGQGRYGSHPSHSMGMPARDLARIGYCMMRDGRWAERQVIPSWFVRETATATHDVKTPELRFQLPAQSFSHGWELPAMRTDGVPPDARFKPGSGGQLIAFVPSLDLVITRQTGSSGDWEYEEYLRRACQAVLNP